DLTKIDRWFLHNVRQIVWNTDLQPAESLTAGRISAGRTGNMPVFRGFDEHAEIQQARRNLPHWEQEGATYFVTFRLADAVPAELAAQWREELQTWRQFHAEPWDAQTTQEYRRRFLQPREDWLDQGYGRGLLGKAPASEIVADV